MNFVIFRYSKKASGLPGFGDSAENALQQLMQTCPGAQQLIAQGLKKDVPPTVAIMGIMETHLMVKRNEDDDKAGMRETMMFHLRLTNDEGDAKFKTKWTLLDSIPIDGKTNCYPIHGHMLSTIFVNKAQDSAQYIFHRFKKVNDTIRFYSTNLIRFYTRNNCRMADALVIVSSEEWEQPCFFELAVSIYINGFFVPHVLNTRQEHHSSHICSSHSAHTYPYACTRNV